jgi:phage-related protein
VAAFNAVVSAVRALGNALLAVLRPVVAFIAQTFTVAWSALSTVVSAVGNVISIAMTTAASIALAVLRPVADFLSGVFRAAVAATGVAFQAAGTVIGTVAHGIASFIGFIVDSFKTASASATALKQSIAGAFNSAKDTITGAFNAAATAVKTAITNILTFVKGIPQSILDALGDLGSLLVQAGKDIIDGLVRGIESAFGKVKGALGKLTNLIPVSKGPPARDRKLLTPVGQMIIGGLITGLESRYDAVRASLQDFTASLAPALDVSGSLAGISGSVAVSHTVGLTPEDRALLLAQSRRQVVLETDGRPIAKLVGARAVRDRVRG